MTQFLSVTPDNVDLQLRALIASREALSKSFHTATREEDVATLDEMIKQFKAAASWLSMIGISKPIRDEEHPEGGHTHNWNFNRSTGHLECMNKPCESVNYG